MNPTAMRSEEGPAVQKMITKRLRKIDFNSQL